MAYKVKPLTKKKTEYFIKDETKAEKEYHKYGFHSIARDEGKHKKYFQNIKERRF